MNRMTAVLLVGVCAWLNGPEVRSARAEAGSGSGRDSDPSSHIAHHPMDTVKSSRATPLYSMEGYKRAFGKDRAELHPPDYSEGSLWSEGSLFNSPFDYEPRTDFQIGDIITVVVKENFETRDDLRVQNEAETELTFNMTRLWTNELERQLFGRIPGTNGTIDFPKASIEGTDNYDAQSRGRQRSKLIIEIPCTVRKILPDGRLLIEGRNSRVIGRDRKHYMLSGTVRPEDVDPEKRTVPSTRVADSQIRWEGKGPNQDTLKPGLVNRILDYIPLF